MNEDTIELMLFGVGFLIPMMMFLATGFSFAGKAKQQDNSSKKTTLAGKIALAGVVIQHYVVFQ